MSAPTILVPPPSQTIASGTIYERLQDINDLGLTPKVAVTLTLLDGNGATQYSQTAIQYTCNTGAIS